MNELTKIYLGYYNQYGTPLIVSENKKIVKQYLKNHRFLQKTQIKIYKENRFNESSFTEDFKDQIATEYHGYYLPAIDIEILEYNRPNLRNSIQATIDQLKHFTLLTGSMRFPESKIKPMVSTIKILADFIENEESYEKLEKADRVMNSILYAEITDYLRTLSSFKEIRRMREDYEFNMRKDD